MTIPTTMQAVVTHGPRDYRVEAVPVPDGVPGEHKVGGLLDAG